MLQRGRLSDFVMYAVAFVISCSTVFGGEIASPSPATLAEFIQPSVWSTRFKRHKQGSKCDARIKKYGQLCCQLDYERRNPIVSYLLYSDNLSRVVPNKVGYSRGHVDDETECFDVVCGRREPSDESPPANCSYLYLMICSGQTNLVSILLNMGANTRKPCSEYSSPLLAVEWNKKRLGNTHSIIKLLLHYGAQVDGKDNKTGNTILHKAVHSTVVHDVHSSLFNDSMSIVKTLLNHTNSTDVLNMKNINGDTPLHVAMCLVSSEQACNGNDLMVQVLLDKGADVLQKNNSKWTCLHIAASSCDLRSARLLIQSRANVNARLSDGRTVMHMKICSRRMTKLFLDGGAYVNAKQDDGNTPLYNAILEFYNLNDGQGNSSTPIYVTDKNSEFIPGVVKLLLERGADPDAKNNAGWAPLLVATREARNHTSDAVFRLLLDHGADTNIRHGDKTPLFLAEHNCNLGVIRLLLCRGADVNARLNDGATVLHQNMCTVDMAKLLLDAGGDVNAKKNDGSTPLHVAIHEFHKLNGRHTNGSTSLHVAIYKYSEFIPGIVKLLLERGANPDAKNSAGWTPLLVATREASNNTDDTIVKRLLDHGASPNIQNEGRLPLLLAADNCNPAMVLLLLDRGADVSARSSDGATVLHQNICTEVIAKLLFDAGADVNAKKNDGSTPLHVAVRGFNSLNPDVTKFFLEHGADPNAEDITGNTPFSEAFWRWKEYNSAYCAIVKSMLDHGADILLARNYTRKQSGEEDKMGLGLE